MRTQPWNLNLYKQTKCFLAARSHIPTQNSNIDWQVGLRNLEALFTWQKILHRLFVTEKYYFRYAFVFTRKKPRWSVLKTLGANFLDPGPLSCPGPISCPGPGQVLSLTPPLDANAHVNKRRRLWEFESCWVRLKPKVKGLQSCLWVLQSLRVFALDYINTTIQNCFFLF